MGRHGKKQGKGVRPPAFRRGAVASEQPSGPLAGRGGAWLVLGIALVLVVLSYANAIHGQFVYDDQKQILRNPLIQEPHLLGKALVSDVWAFTGAEEKVWSNYWRPLFVAGLSLQRITPPGAPGLDSVVWSAPSLLLFYLRHALWPFGLGPSYPFKPVTGRASRRRAFCCRSPPSSS